MECNGDYLNILKGIWVYTLENSDKLKNLTDIIISILGGICVITGLNYLKNLKEKKYAATFGFWVQLGVKLRMIMKRLEGDKNLANNLFSEESRTSWTNIAEPPYPDDIKELKSLAEKTLELIDTATDQMPAYRGWTEDYSKLIIFLDDLFQYDISNAREKFKYTGVHPVETRDDCVDKACATIKRLLEGIEDAQKSLERDLF